MKVKFEEYKARKIVNIHKHADSWFWDKYSATPYVGCRMWAYRNAAWIVDDLKESISDIFREKGMEGLTALPGIGRRIAGQITGCIK